MAFISEIHYSNGVANSSGVAEYAEVTLSPKEFVNASDFELVAYQHDGTVAETFNLGDVTPVQDPDTGWYVYQLTTPISSPDHIAMESEAEAIALVDLSPGGEGVISFYDIGGGTSEITAIEGAAIGATSVNIPNKAGGSDTIQFDKTGNRIDGAMSQGSSVICFASGTLIDTSRGSKPVEALRPGDLVRTLGNGLQPLLLSHAQSMTAHALRDSPAARPVRIARGALGHGLPRRDLRVSQQHRMLLDGAWFTVMFDAPHALVRAKSLPLALPGVTIDTTCRPVTYFHLVFERHEIIFAEGAPTESFHPGRTALSALQASARAELYRLFPALRVGETRPEAPYRTLDAWEWIAAAA